MRQVCEHAATMQPVGEHKNVCEDCIIEGTRWVHLRQCLGLRPDAVLRQQPAAAHDGPTGRASGTR